MHRSGDIQVGIFEPWDWVYFQAHPSWARAETCQKLMQTQFLIVLNTGISKTYKKSIWRGTGSRPNPNTFRLWIEYSVLGNA
jgi:hypothetical protein